MQIPDIADVAGGPAARVGQRRADDATTRRLCIAVRTGHVAKRALNGRKVSYKLR
jgi:hypothetical protein